MKNIVEKVKGLKTEEKIWATIFTIVLGFVYGCMFYTTAAMWMNGHYIIGVFSALGTIYMIIAIIWCIADYGKKMLYGLEAIEEYEIPNDGAE